jgi:hypothetical protein
VSSFSLCVFSCSFRNVTIRTEQLQVALEMFCPVEPDPSGPREEMMRSAARRYTITVQIFRAVTTRTLTTEL